ncbi:hypothetical protein HBB16_04610 [Pseudonocardia sp. MCCB 268]|nr:hypothetical protein [Pseudonocardia cytotoxica]
MLTSVLAAYAWPVDFPARNATVVLLIVCTWLVGAGRDAAELRPDLPARPAGDADRRRAAAARHGSRGAPALPARQRVSRGNCSTRPRWTVAHRSARWSACCCQFIRPAIAAGHRSRLHRGVEPKEYFWPTMVLRRGGDLIRSGSSSFLTSGGTTWGER